MEDKYVIAVSFVDIPDKLVLCENGEETQLVNVKEKKKIADRAITYNRSEAIIETGTVRLVLENIGLPLTVDEVDAVKLSDIVKTEGLEK
jgi:hypothetical protein